MFKCVLVLAFVSLAAAIPVDNGVEGDPEIECGPTSITINFNTQNNFEGHVYVKNLYADEACRNDEGGRQVAGIELPFDTCNVARTRSLNPKGIFVSTTVIISFHPLFMTKVDRAYTIQCFYMEADKTVSTEIEVSMITTGFQTQVVPMPVCRYEILEGGPSGPPVQYALIGDQVYHKWTCDTETIDTFCMIVYSCFVDDGNGDVVDLIDEQGCANDRYLMNNLEYPTDLMGGVEAHVFKYTDRAALFFQCQIQITVKEPNGQCERPDCPEPSGRGDGSGSRRASSRSRSRTRGRFARSTEESNVWDVRASMQSLDVDDQVSLPSELRHRAPTTELFHYRPVVYSEQNGVCLSTSGFVGLAVFGLAILVSLGAAISCYFVRK